MGEKVCRIKGEIGRRHTVLSGVGGGTFRTLISFCTMVRNTLASMGAALTAE